MQITIKQQRRFTWELNGVEIERTFDDVLASPDWINFRKIVMTYRDGLGMYCRTQLFKETFLQNLVTHNKKLRGEETYEYDKQEYILYRLLEGETRESAKAEVANLEAQRALLDAKNEEYKKTVTEALKAHIAREDENEDIRMNKERIAELTTQFANEQDEERKKELQSELGSYLEMGSQLREFHKIPLRAEIPPKDFSIPKEMQKMVQLALDPTVPEITLKNVSLDNLNS